MQKSNTCAFSWNLNAATFQLCKRNFHHCNFPSRCKTCECTKNIAFCTEFCELQICILWSFDELFFCTISIHLQKQLKHVSNFSTMSWIFANFNFSCVFNALVKNANASFRNFFGGKSFGLCMCQHCQWVSFHWQNDKNSDWISKHCFWKQWNCWINSKVLACMLDWRKNMFCLTIELAFLCTNWHLSWNHRVLTNHNWKIKNQFTLKSVFSFASICIIQFPKTDGIFCENLQSHILKKMTERFWQTFATFETQFDVKTFQFLKELWCDCKINCDFHTVIWTTECFEGGLGQSQLHSQWTVFVCFGQAEKSEKWSPDCDFLPTVLLPSFTSHLQLVLPIHASCKLDEVQNSVQMSGNHKLGFSQTNGECNNLNFSKMFCPSWSEFHEDSGCSCWSEQFHTCSWKIVSEMAVFSENCQKSQQIRDRCHDVWSVKDVVLFGVVFRKKRSRSNSLLITTLNTTLTRNRSHSHGLTNETRLEFANPNGSLTVNTGACPTTCSHSSLVQGASHQLSSPFWTLWCLWRENDSSDHKQKMRGHTSIQNMLVQYNEPRSKCLYKSVKSRNCQVITSFIWSAATTWLR